MTNTKKRFYITTAVLAVAVIIACILGFTLPKALASQLDIEIDLMSEADVNVNSQEENIGFPTPSTLAQPRAFSRYKKELQTTNGLDYNIDLDARDSIFCDDILITFNVLNGSSVTFYIKVTFYFSDWSGGSKGESWTITANKGNRLMNSGKYQVYKMVCEWHVTYNGETTKETYTFNK